MALLGMVVFVSPFPLEDVGALGLLSLIVAVAVFLITSVMDEKSGMFCFGLGDAGLLIMVFISFVLFVGVRMGVVATLSVFCLGGVSFAIRNAQKFIKAKEKTKLRFPFTAHLFFGYLLTVFVFL